MPGVVLAPLGQFACARPAHIPIRGSASSHSLPRRLSLASSAAFPKQPVNTTLHLVPSLSPRPRLHGSPDIQKLLCRSWQSTPRRPSRPLMDCLLTAPNARNRRLFLLHREERDHTCTPSHMHDGAVQPPPAALVGEEKERGLPRHARGHVRADERVVAGRSVQRAEAVVQLWYGRVGVNDLNSYAIQPIIKHEDTNRGRRAAKPNASPPTQTTHVRTSTRPSPSAASGLSPSPVALPAIVFLKGAAFVLPSAERPCAVSGTPTICRCSLAWGGNCSMCTRYAFWYCCVLCEGWMEGLGQRGLCAMPSGTRRPSFLFFSVHTQTDRPRHAWRGRRASRGRAAPPSWAPGPSAGAAASSPACVRACCAIRKAVIPPLRLPRRPPP